MDLVRGSNLVPRLMTMFLSHAHILHTSVVMLEHFIVVVFLTFSLVFSVKIITTFSQEIAAARCMCKKSEFSTFPILEKKVRFTVPLQ